MITLFIRYTLDPHKLAEFERYAQTWPEVVRRYGGELIGYFAPTKIAGPTNVGYALIRFPSHAVYEKYRESLMSDPEVVENVRRVEESKTILVEERSMVRQVS
jgi:uncharacterized protein (DUF1330 family)